MAVPILQSTHFHRVYAAYGGIFIVMAVGLMEFLLIHLTYWEVNKVKMNFRTSFGEEIIEKVGSCVILGRRPKLDMVTE